MKVTAIIILTLLAIKIMLYLLIRCLFICYEKECKTGTLEKQNEFKEVKKQVGSILLGMFISVFSDVLTLYMCYLILK